MAHFAKLDSNNTIVDVLVVANTDILDENGNESEVKGIQFLKNLFGEDTNWIQTSYNGNFRKRYAAIGGTYDSVSNVFIHPKPYPSWTLNNQTYEWEPPVPYPSNHNYMYIWNEETISWIENPNASNTSIMMPDYEVE
jgi:hypothetical protein